jgi:hypothetical protein
MTIKGIGGCLSQQRLLDKVTFSSARDFARAALGGFVETDLLGALS